MRLPRVGPPSLTWCRVQSLRGQDRVRGFRRARDADGQVMIMAVGAIVVFLCVGRACRRCRELVRASPSSCRPRSTRRPWPADRHGRSRVPRRWTRRSRARRGSTWARIAVDMLALPAPCSRTSLNNQIGGAPGRPDACRPERAVWSTSDEPCRLLRRWSECAGGIGLQRSDASGRRDRAQRLRRYSAALSIDLHAKARVALREIDGLADCCRSPSHTEAADRRRRVLRRRRTREDLPRPETAARSDGVRVWRRVSPGLDGLGRDDAEHADDPDLGADGA